MADNSRKDSKTLWFMTLPDVLLSRLAGSFF